MPYSTLLAVLDDLERDAGVGAFHFIDGEILDLRVISTMHAEEGEDVVTEVIRIAHPIGSTTIAAGAFLNFALADVSRIIVNGASVFNRPELPASPPPVPQRLRRSGPPRG